MGPPETGLTTAAGDGFTPPFILLEDRLGSGAAFLYTKPEQIIRCTTDGIDDSIGRIEQGMKRGLHAAGLLSYELGYGLEPRLAPRMPRPLEAPLLWFGLFPPPVRIEAAALDERFAALGPPPPIRQLQAGSTRAQHMAKVEQALRLIEAGDIYQVNLTFPFRFRYGDDPLRLYGALRARQPVAHGGVAALGDLTILSVSPELWIETVGGEVTTRPMKGTTARGADHKADVAAKAALASDPKQRAENLMIVDLLRNDLARVSVAGSVRVPRLFTVETYPDFHTLTSTIVGRLDPLAGLRERLAALFPCGSIVGAPKIRAAEIIRDLEEAPRGFYTGALGAISPNGDMRFNVAIRTAVVSADGTGVYGVGGGIVADSDPGGEYDEALLKGKVLTDLSLDYGLIETFRWSPAEGFVRLHLHLDRLGRSARRLAFRFDRSSVEWRLEQEVEGWVLDGSDRRVRLLLGRDGALEISHQPLAPSKARLRVSIAPHRVDPGDPFTRHKTTRRDLYDRAFDAAAKDGFDEALLLNRRGEIAEASRNSVFVQLGDRLVTPPLSSGALPGVLRQHLLDTNAAVEGLVTPDLLRGRQLLLGNSLHGLRDAQLVSA